MNGTMRNGSRGGVDYVHGVWEDTTFNGCLVWGRLGSDKGHNIFGIEPNELLELKRIALRGHDVPVTQILKQSIALVKRANSDIQVLLSYADPSVGHTGYVYQAASWV